MIGECPNGKGLLKQHRWNKTLDVRRCELCGRCEHEVFDWHGFDSLGSYKWIPVSKSVYDEDLKDALRRLAIEKQEEKERRDKERTMAESWQQP